MSSVVQQGLMNLKADTAALGPAHRIYPHDHRYLRRMYAKAATAAELNPFRFHDLRHIFASRLALKAKLRAESGVKPGVSLRWQTARVRNPLRKLEREKGFEPSTLALASVLVRM